MKIFIIGQCTLHWGRMEFGNIGNYYVIEPFFRQLHRVFPSAEIVTTFQMSEQFCKNENIKCVPMSEYYGWQDDDLLNAYKEYALANLYSQTGELIEETPYIDDVLSSDLIIDYSGDIWGQNADFVGPHRFLVGLLKDRVAQLLGKPTVMIAGSPGPFSRDAILPFAKEVFSNFKFVTTREPISKSVLLDFGFDISRVSCLACPAFIYEQDSQESIAHLIQDSPLQDKKSPVLGFMLCGWNMLKGPYSRTDWQDDEFLNYVNLIVELVHRYNFEVCLMSHSNGFELPPHFKPIQGRDFPIAKQLYDLLKRTDIKDSVYLFDGVYTPGQTKAIIRNFDMVISGRVHGAIAALSQNIPTVIVDYGHEPKAHKLRGFSIVAGCEDYFSNPANYTDILSKSCKCWENRVKIHQFLIERNKIIHQQVMENFDMLKNIVSE